MPSPVCQSSRLSAELRHLSSSRWKEWGAKRWEQPEPTLLPRALLWNPGCSSWGHATEQRCFSPAWRCSTEPSEVNYPSSHTTSSPTNAIGTLLQPPHGTHSNIRNARSGTPLTGIFRLYSIKGEKKKAAQFNNCRSVYSLPEPPRIRDFYLPLRSPDSLPPLSITGWIITAWNLPCHFPAPWRNFPCPHPSDNAHCEQECQSRDGQRSLTFLTPRPRVTLYNC